MANVTSELQWVRMLLTEIGMPMKESSTLHCDNQSAVHIASNPVYHERTKHIEVDCHFVRDELKAQTVSVFYVHTSQQPADIFTKGLGAQQFQHLLGKLGVRDLHTPT